MKLLRNPWIVALLFLGAVGVIGVQIFHPSGPPLPIPLMHRQDFGVTVNSPPSLPSASASPVAPSPAAGIDNGYVRSRFAAWLGETQHDPFYQAKPVVTLTNSIIQQLSKLKLEAIWRQDGVSVVAINKAVYRVGDPIVGGKILRIDENGVWLEYAGQKEFVVFGSEAAQPTSGPPPAFSPSP